MLRLKTVQFACLCGQERFSVRTSRGFINDFVSLDIHTSGDRFDVTVSAREELRIVKLCAVFEHSFAETDRIFLSGYQSWTDSIEHGIHSKMRGIDHIPAQLRDRYSFSQYGDYTFVKYPEKSGCLHGFTYGYVRSGETYSFMGSLAEDSGFTVIRTDTGHSEVSFEKDCRGLSLSSGSAYQGLSLLLTEGCEAQVFDRYFSLSGVTLRPEARPIFGYTSWYRHYQDISEDVILTDLKGLKSQPCKADVFQIDDGYQTAVGDWLSVDSGKFPLGMEPVAERIFAEGYTPGIWLAPFVCEENSEIFRSHKDWLVKDSHGNYVRGGSNWSGFYAMDFYNPQVRHYLRQVFDTIVNGWGFRLLKLDFLYAVCILPRSTKTRGQIMAEAMDFLRECAGDALILGCGVPLGSAFGRVDYCRIGCDVSLDWNDKPYMRLTHRERVSTRNTILNSVFRRQLNGRAFLNDPDVFILRSRNNTLTDEQKRCLAEVNAAAGSVLFTSDNTAEYTPEQLRTLSEIMDMRNAEIVSAGLYGSTLKVQYSLGDKLIQRNYDI